MSRARSGCPTSTRHAAAATRGRPDPSAGTPVLYATAFAPLTALPRRSGFPAAGQDTAGQDLLEELAGVAFLGLGDLLRRPVGHHLAAAGTALGPEVDNPV